MAFWRNLLVYFSNKNTRRFLRFIMSIFYILKIYRNDDAAVLLALFIHHRQFNIRWECSTRTDVKVSRLGRWQIEVAGIGTRYRDTDTMALAKLVGDRQHIKDELDSFTPVEFHFIFFPV